MPSSQQILDGLAKTANEWHMIAIAWHVVLGLLLISLVFGRRPSQRLVGFVLLAPLLSVSALALRVANPFNGGIFGGLAIGLAAAIIYSPQASVRIAAPGLAALGGLLVAFGWVYPHFLEAAS